jgi:hypothetical protein
MPAAVEEVLREAALHLQILHPEVNPKPETLV